MDWGYKAALTTVTVAAVLMTAQLFGRRLAGLVAGMPVITAPALIWMGLEQGAQFAAHAAVGGVAVCSALALFAAVYARLAYRTGPALTMPAALSFAALATAALQMAGEDLAALLALALASCAVMARLMPADQPDQAPARRLRGEVLYASAAAGVISATVSWAATDLGPFWCSVLMSLPIVTTTVAVHQHLAAGADSVARFMHGNLAGTVGRALFCGAFAIAVLPIGLAGAIVLSLVAGCIGAIGATRALAAVRGRQRQARPM